jgi:hypothetical protein
MLFLARPAHFSARDQQTHFLQACGNLSGATIEFCYRRMKRREFFGA